MSYIIHQVHASPAANEVQSITTSAWGTQPEVRQFKVAQNVLTSEAAVQTVKVAVSHVGDIQTIALDSKSLFFYPHSHE